MKEKLKLIFLKYSKIKNFNWNTIPLPILPQENNKKIVNLKNSKNNLVNKLIKKTEKKNDFKLKNENVYIREDDEEEKDDNAIEEKIKKNKKKEENNLVNKLIKKYDFKLKNENVYIREDEEEEKDDNEIEEKIKENKKEEENNLVNKLIKKYDFKLKNENVYIREDDGEEKEDNEIEEKIKENKKKEENKENEENIIKIGTNNNLEKNYSRITEFVDFTKVRPENILNESLTFILNKYLSKEEDSEYLLNQLRSIKQDLLVQNIRNDFTVKIYEFIVKFSLIFSNLEEYSLSSRELMQMYSEGFCLPENRIYYYYYWIIYLSINSSYFELNSFIINLRTDILNHKKIKKALKFKNDLSKGNFSLIFSYIKNKRKNSPLKGLLKYYINKFRVWRLKLLSSYYVIDYSLINLQNDLLFKEYEEMINFLKFSSNLNRSYL